MALGSDRDRTTADSLADFLASNRKSAYGVSAAVLIAIAAAGVAWKLRQTRHDEQGLDTLQKEAIHELSRLVARAESEVGVTTRLGRAIQSVRHSRHDVEWLAVRIDALAGNSMMDKALLRGLQDALQALQRELETEPEDTT